MYDYLIFDFDGTISDTYPIYTRALLSFLADRGITADYDEVYAEFKNSVGHAYRKYGVSSDDAPAAKQRYKELARQVQQTFPDAKEILEYTKSLGKHNYIYTHTGKFVYELLDRDGLTGYFDFILDGSYDFPRKPAPDGLNFLIEKCGIDRSRALMIGDRSIDTDAARNAGIAGCLIDTGGFFPSCVTDHYIKSLSELKNII